MCGGCESVVPLCPREAWPSHVPRIIHFLFIEASWAVGAVGYKMAQGFFSLKGLVAAGMPTRKGSLLACSAQNCSRSPAALDTFMRSMPASTRSCSTARRACPMSLPMATLLDICTKASRVVGSGLDSRP